MKTNSMILNKEWSARPSDERFLTVEALYERVSARRVSSDVTDVALDSMLVQPTDGGELLLTDSQGERGGLLTHYAFGQLCARAKAPAGYLRTLPAELAAIPLQWSLENHEAASDEGNDAKLLARTNGHRSIAAVTSPTYGRIWDKDVVAAIVQNVDLDRWKVPAATYSGTDPMRATTLYASDRDVFMFLCSANQIEADGECLNRGFYVYNSEVGSATFGVAMFLYDRVCDNRIIWGMREFREIKIRHTSGGPHRFVANAVPQLSAYAESKTDGVADVIRLAKAKEVGRDRKSVVEWMRARGFSTPQASKAYDAAKADPRGYNPRSVWGLVQGATDAAHSVTNTDERTEIETRAGSLLDTVTSTVV